MRKISVITATLLCLGSYAHAAEDLASALTNGKWEKRIRTQYFYTDWDDNSVTGKNGDDAKGLAVGGSLLYKTAPLHGFTAGLGVYATTNPFQMTDEEDGKTATTSLDLFRRAGSQKFYGEGYAVLAQAYLGYDFARSKTRAGRFLMKNPWVTPNDTKMIPIAVQGLELVSNDIPNTKIQLDYMDAFKERGEIYFGNMADGLDVPNAIRKQYSTHYNTGDDSKGDSSGVVVAGVTNKSIDNLELQAWGMHWDGLVSQARVEANYGFKLGDVNVGLGGLGIMQFDNGAGKFILPKANNGDNDNSIDTHLVALRTTMNYGNAKLLLAGSQTSNDGDLIAPWRAFPTNGYTRSKTITDWNAGTKAYKIGLGYDFKDSINGLSANLSYSKYDRDESKKPYASATNRGFANGDTNQWNLDVVQKLSGKFKGVELKARFMDQENKPTMLTAATQKELSNREMRLEANYRF